jgi:hypothetical protein
LLGNALFGQHPINGKLIMSSSLSEALGAWAGGKLKECCPDIILLACWPKMPLFHRSRRKDYGFRVAGFQKRG